MVMGKSGEELQKRCILQHNIFGGSLSRGDSIAQKVSATYSQYSIMLKREERPGTRLYWRSVVPLVELAPDELRLSAHTNQNSGPSALERGDYRVASCSPMTRMPSGRVIAG